MDALLLIHGFPLDRRTWAAQTDGLKDAARVLAPDLPGFGSSPPEPSIRTMDDYARWLLAFLDAQGVKRFAAAGHSMGGYILFALHRLAPERLSAVALVSTRANADTDEGRQARETTAQRAEKEGAGFLADTMPSKLLGPAADPKGAVQVRFIIRSASPAGTAAAARAMGSRPNATSQLSRIAVPALVVAGRHDAIVPPAESESMAKAIPGATLVWAEHSGHLPMMEEPDVVTRALATLVAG